MEEEASGSGPASGGQLEPSDVLAQLPIQPVTMNQIVAWNVLYFRKVVGLTQEEFGERLGWSKAIVSAAERSWNRDRTRQFSVDDLVAIALAFGIPVVALLLPPSDAGTAVRYLLETEAGQPDVTSLLPVLAPAYGGESPTLSAYRQRVMALGASKYMDSPSEEADQILQRARDEASRMLARAAEYGQEVTGDARAKADALQRDAADRHRLAMSTLVQSREQLERRVDDLRAFEREYRSRLLAYLEGQIIDLKAGTADSSVFPAVVNTPQGAAPKEGQP